LNHWKIKQEKLKQEYEAKCEELRNKEILINEQEHIISKRDSLQRDLKSVKESNKDKEDQIRKLKYMAHEAEFMLNNQKQEM